METKHHAVVAIETHFTGEDTRTTQVIKINKLPSVTKVLDYSLKTNINEKKPGKLIELIISHYGYSNQTTNEWLCMNPKYPLINTNVYTCI